MNIGTIAQIAAVVFGSGVLSWNYWPVVKNIVFPSIRIRDSKEMPFDIECVLAIAKQLALRGEAELAEKLREIPAKRFEELPSNDNPQAE